MTGKLKAFGSTVMGTQGAFRGAPGGGMVALDPKPRWGGEGFCQQKIGARVFVRHFLEFFFVCEWVGWGGTYTEIEV